MTIDGADETNCTSLQYSNLCLGLYLFRDSPVRNIGTARDESAAFRCFRHYLSVAVVFCRSPRGADVDGRAKFGQSVGFGLGHSRSRARHVVNGGTRMLHFWVLCTASPFPHA